MENHLHSDFQTSCTVEEKSQVSEDGTGENYLEVAEEPDNFEDAHGTASTLLESLDESEKEALKEFREWVTAQPHLNPKKCMVKIILSIIRVPVYSESCAIVESISDWLSDLGCQESPKRQMQMAEADLDYVKFLMISKFNLDRAKERFTNFYLMKANVPEWFSNRDPLLPELQALLDLGVFLPLLKKDSCGRQIFLVRAGGHNPKVHTQENIFKLGCMMVDYLLERDEDIIRNGVILLVDLEGITYQHALHLPPSLVKKALNSWQNCYPIKIKRFDLINVATCYNVVLNIFRKFMKQKLKDRMHTHGYNIESLHKFVSPEALLDSYQGSGGSLEDHRDYWKKTITAAREWFLENEKYKPDAPLSK